MSDSNVQTTQNVIAEVASRLRETERRAATVISALEQAQSTKDSLDVAGKGLFEANSLIAEFARVTKRATEEFADTVSVLRGAIDVLQQVDPGEIKSRLDEIDQRVRGVEGENKNLRGHIDTELVRLRDSVKSTADAIVDRLLQQVDPGEIKSRLDEIDQRIRGVEGENKNLRGHIDTELVRLRDSVKSTADAIIDRLTPRSIWEGMFGRRKG